jgi:hypothetical protein
MWGLRVLVSGITRHFLGTNQELELKKFKFSTYWGIAKFTQGQSE